MGIDIERCRVAYDVPTDYPGNEIGLSLFGKVLIGLGIRHLAKAYD